jgi:hypothetical protein
MTIDWKPLTNAPFAHAPGEVEALWLIACDDFKGATHLRVTASGTWAPGAPPSWGPDGDVRHANGPTTPILAGAPLGALIGKIGGSSAGLGVAPPAPAAGSAGGDKGAPTLIEDQVFLLGASCTFALPVKAAGPLFVGFNCALRPIRITAALTVTVEGATPTF